MKFAGLATVIPLSIFTKMMNQHFVKLKYLESESDTYERESSPSSPVRSLSSPRGGTGRGGWDNVQWTRTGTKGHLSTFAKVNGRWHEEVIVITMAEGQVGIAYRRQMKLCGLGESMGGINN